MHIRVLGLAALVTLPMSARAQAIPTTRAAAVAYDVEMVRRAAKRMDSPAHWDRDDSGRCPRNATRFSILCALQTTLMSRRSTSTRFAGATSATPLSRVSAAEERSFDLARFRGSWTPSRIRFVGCGKHPDQKRVDPKERHWRGLEWITRRR